jgi:hypothetical protein
MNPMMVRRIRVLIPLYVRPEGDLPPADADGVISFLDEYLGRGLPEFRPLYYAAVLAIFGLCRLRKGRSLARLADGEALAFLESLYESRLASLRSLPLLLGMPVYMAHYSRDDIQPLLGFPVEELRKEAEQREVKR